MAKKILGQWSFEWQWWNIWEGQRTLAATKAGELLNNLEQNECDRLFENIIQDMKKGYVTEKGKMLWENGRFFHMNIPADWDSKWFRLDFFMGNDTTFAEFDKNKNLRQNSFSIAEIDEIKTKLKNFVLNKYKIPYWYQENITQRVFDYFLVWNPWCWLSDKKDGNQAYQSHGYVGWNSVDELENSGMHDVRNHRSIMLKINSKWEIVYNQIYAEQLIKDGNIDRFFEKIREFKSLDSKIFMKVVDLLKEKRADRLRWTACNQLCRAIKQWVFQNLDRECASKLIEIDEDGNGAEFIEKNPEKFWL